MRLEVLNEPLQERVGRHRLRVGDDRAVPLLCGGWDVCVFL